eukprot:293067_1
MAMETRLMWVVEAVNGHDSEDKYPAVQPGGPAIGGGGKWTGFGLFCHAEQRAADYGHEHFFGNESQVVLCGYFGKYEDQARMKRMSCVSEKRYMFYSLFVFCRKISCYNVNYLRFI